MKLYEFIWSSNVISNEIHTKIIYLAFRVNEILETNIYNGIFAQTISDIQWLYLLRPQIHKSSPK